MTYICMLYSTIFSVYYIQLILKSCLLHSSRSKRQLSPAVPCDDSSFSSALRHVCPALPLEFRSARACFFLAEIETMKLHPLERNRTRLVITDHVRFSSSFAQTLHVVRHTPDYALTGMCSPDKCDFVSLRYVSRSFPMTKFCMQRAAQVANLKSFSKLFFPDGIQK